MEIKTLLLVFASTFLGAWGSYFFRLSSKKIEKMTLSGIIFVLMKPTTILGFALFLISSLTYIWALSQEKLTMVYPLTALSYIWAAFIGRYCCGEKVDKWRWLAIVSIFLGVGMLLLAMKS